MSDTTFSFQVDEKLKKRFTEAARTQECNAEQLLSDFMSDFVKRQSEIDAQFRESVKQGMASANAGNLVPAADVEAMFAVRREKTRKSIAKREIVCPVSDQMR